MHSSLAFLGLAVTTSALPSIQGITQQISKRAPPEAKGVIRNVTSSGSGCASNSAAFIISDNATLAFDSMVVDTVTTPSVTCIVSVDLGLDKGWKYIINAKG